MPGPSRSGAWASRSRFRTDHGLSEASTQGLFSKSYLAWSFKPFLGFLIDAYGRMRTILTILLGPGVIGSSSWTVFSYAVGHRNRQRPNR
jgi:hypothetical protein